MFKDKTIDGITYGLSHLRPMSLSLPVTKRAVTIEVCFGCHVFTDAYDPSLTPDWHYHHDGERRTFSIARYAFSQFLPSLIRGLPGQTVYHTRQSNFFFLRSNLLPHLGDPYVCFFNMSKATKSDDFDLLMHVQSAYPKVGMTQRAAPVSFVNLANSTFTKSPLRAGELRTIKR